MAAYDATDGLRILCGAFLLPHAWGKVASPGPLKFFETAGFPRPALFMYLALAIEALAAIALLCGLWVRPVAWVTAAFLLVASAASFKVSQRRWIWLTGGCEYPVFWALCCVIVAMSS
jgi:putative oxidoreductase